MFRATRAASMKYTGTSLETLRQTAGSGFKNSTDSASKSIEERVSQCQNCALSQVGNLQSVSSGDWGQNPVSLVSFVEYVKT